LGPKKISTNLKYHLLDHMAGKAVRAYGAGKTHFWDIDINLMDWTTIEKVIKGQTINMQRWTIKFITGLCAMGCQMLQTKQCPTADCPCYRHPNEDTSHILQCAHPDSQLLWDSAILQLREHLHNNDTSPSLIKDLSARIDAWSRQAIQPPAITPARKEQAALTWQNLIHGFLSLDWKHQQAISYTNKKPPWLPPGPWTSSALYLNMHANSGIIRTGSYISFILTESKTWC